MKKSLPVMTITGTLWIALPGPAWAGMPMLTIGDVAILRLQTISFFLMGFLLSALLIQLLWNGLQREWDFLPRLTFLKALGVVSLWGLLFILVLTMISGARELMTPGAWVKQGVTYKLATPPAGNLDSVSVTTNKKRENQLVKLRTALWQFAGKNQGHFPSEVAILELPQELRQVPEAGSSGYLYVQGLKAGQGPIPLLYEPEVFENDRWVLLANSEIRLMDTEELMQALTLVQP